MSTPASAGPVPHSDARILVLTRVGCHLCETAERDVREIAACAGVDVEILDLDGSDPLIRSAWTDHVPVTIVDGTVVSLWAVDPGRVRAALARASRPASSRSQLWTAGGDSPTGVEGSGR